MRTVQLWSTHRSSIVLLRIENNGVTDIDAEDYAGPEEDKVGLRVKFPGRTVVGMVVTEFSDDYLRHFFDEGRGLGVRGDEIELPKVQLTRSTHYKVLAALDRAPGNTNGDREQVTAPTTGFEAPKVVGAIKRGRIQETRSRTGTSRWTVALMCFLVAVILAQLFVPTGNSSPLDCATGNLTVVGSTAFRQVLEDATNAYKNTCPDAKFTLDLKGSGEGLIRLNGESDHSAMLAFSDGEKPDGYPQLLPRPIAFSLFTLVINKDAGVQDLTTEQIKKSYQGRITTWNAVGGNNKPVVLVGRRSDSGSRKTFEKRVLVDIREPDETYYPDCRVAIPGAQAGVARCEQASTNDLLDAVEKVPGALGYSDLGSASGRDNLTLVRIDGHPAGLAEADHGAYHFWETEYAYTYGEPAAGSLAASFLRYLTNEVGKDIVRSHGHRPCAELQNPVSCRPSGGTDQARPQ
jgi:phosphate transport system substrate-binding protein